MAELKPCPFCGSPAELLVLKNIRTKVICTNAECYLNYTSPTIWNNGDSDEHAEQLMATWWNGRV